MYLLAQRGSHLGGHDRGFLKEGVKTCLVAAISPFHFQVLVFFFFHFIGFKSIVYTREPRRERRHQQCKRCVTIP
jgi:hypothetical protein